MSLDAVRFYNGQTTPFSQKFVYTKPDTDFRDENGQAYWNIEEPPRTFFSVPFELETSTGGTWRISIHREITDRFGLRGLVRVDGNSRQAMVSDFEKQPLETIVQMAEQAIQQHDDLNDFKRIGQGPLSTIQKLLKSEKIDRQALIQAMAEYSVLTATDNRFAYVAFDDASAKLKGDALWRKYQRQTIDDFEYENSRRVTERGQSMLRPTNSIMHAYRELGMQVPGDEKYIQAGIQKTDVSELQATVARQQEQIAQLLELHKRGPVVMTVPEFEESQANQQQEAVGAAAGNGVGNGKDKTHKNK